MRHHHQCPACHFIWEHDEDNLPGGYKYWKQAHTCQQCGQGGLCIDRCDHNGKLYRCYSKTELAIEVAKRRRDAYMKVREDFK